MTVSEKMAEKKFGTSHLRNIFISLRTFVFKPEGFFVVFACFFGFVLVFVVPPMQVPDEQSHFYRAYSITDFNLLPVKFEKDGRLQSGGSLPKSIVEAGEAFKLSVAGNPGVTFNKSMYKQYINQELKPNDRADYLINASYPPIVYIPQAIGIAIGKIFNSSPLIMIWLGRLMNLVAWVLLVYCAIRLLPFAKWALVILALNPMAVFLSASLSADVLTIALSFVFFSLVISTFTKNSILNGRKKYLLIGASVLLALTKPVNVLFSLLLFLIPRRKFNSTKKYFIFCIITVFASIFIAFAWNGVVSESNQIISQIQKPDEGVNPSEQLTGIIENPLNYTRSILINYVIVTPAHYGDAVLKSFFGVFGWLDTEIPLWTIIVYILALFLAILFQFGRGIALSLFQKTGLLVTFTLVVVANITALYLYYTPVGGTTIAGVQGRYFIPAAVLLLGFFTARKKLLNINEKTLCLILGSIISVVLLMTLLRIIIRYYI